MKRIPVYLLVFLLTFWILLLPGQGRAGCGPMSNTDAWKKCAEDRYRTAENRMAKLFNEISARLNADHRHDLSASQASWKRNAKAEAKKECASKSIPPEICVLERMTEKIKEREVMLKEGLW